MHRGSPRTARDVTSFSSSNALTDFSNARMARAGSPLSLHSLANCSWFVLFVLDGRWRSKIYIKNKNKRAKSYEATLPPVSREPPAYSNGLLLAYMWMKHPDVSVPRRFLHAVATQHSTKWQVQQ